MSAIPLPIADMLAGLTLAVVFSLVALGGAIIYFYYKERMKNKQQ
jgi:cytochrome c-type biogenesis protein CcmE